MTSLDLWIIKWYHDCIMIMHFLYQLHNTFDLQVVHEHWSYSWWQSWWICVGILPWVSLTQNLKPIIQQFGKVNVSIAQLHETHLRKFHTSKNCQWHLKPGFWHDIGWDCKWHWHMTWHWHWHSSWKVTSTSTSKTIPI